jgi:hypothetical protein
MMKENYTKAQVKAADLAVELSRKLGDPSDAVLSRMISTGGLIECPVTVEDLQRARAIYGPSVVAVRGKSKRQQSDKVAEPSISASGWTSSS